MKVYYIHINNDDETGMDAISLVDAPAVQYTFLKFSKKSNVMQFRDETKHVITGVVMLADTPIYRYSQEMGEYWIVFEKDTIRQMVEKYAKQDRFNSVNLDHDNQRFTDNVYLIESYLIDKERGLCPKEFEDVPDGSWICSFKVEDENLWKEITTSDRYTGFSLQGLFDLSTEPVKEETEDELIDSMLEK